jgi:urease accessory protein UreE
MGNFFDANYNITKLKTSKGDIVELELNNKKVALAGDVKIQDKKEVIIKVSEYTEPIEIVPSSGKDGIAKVIVTLDTSE